jgi:outer membrane lipoprotein SlyB
VSGLRRTGGICLAAILAGCASAPPKPVFYPNSHLQSAGQAQADQDIAECKQLAHSSGVAEKKDGEVGKKAAAGAAVGGASAGAWGLVRGNAGERALAGAAAGAAAGAVSGGLKKTETSPVFRNFVNRCLGERGYEVIGWQ